VIERPSYSIQPFSDPEAPVGCAMAAGLRFALRTPPPPACLSAAPPTQGAASAGKFRAAGGQSSLMEWTKSSPDSARTESAFCAASPLDAGAALRAAGTRPRLVRVPSGACRACGVVPFPLHPPGSPNRTLPGLRASGLAGPWAAEVEGLAPGRAGAPGAPALALNRPQRRPCAPFSAAGQFQVGNDPLPPNSPNGLVCSLPETLPARSLCLQVAAASMAGTSIRCSLQLRQQQQLTASELQADSRRFPWSSVLTRAGPPGGCSLQTIEGLLDAQDGTPAPPATGPAAGSGSQTRIRQPDWAHLIHPQHFRGP